MGSRNLSYDSKEYFPAFEMTKNTHASRVIIGYAIAPRTNKNIRASRGCSIAPTHYSLGHVLAANPPGCLATAHYGFQPLAFNSSLALRAKLKSKTSANFISLCVFVAAFISSIIGWRIFASLMPSRTVSLTSSS